jgi:hypothetical protein
MFYKVRNELIRQPIGRTDDYLHYLYDVEINRESSGFRVQQLLYMITSMWIKQRLYGMLSNLLLTLKAGFLDSSLVLFIYSGIHPSFEERSRDQNSPTSQLVYMVTLPASRCLRVTTTAKAIYKLFFISTLKARLSVVNSITSRLRENSASLSMI